MTATGGAGTTGTISRPVPAPGRGPRSLRTGSARAGTLRYVLARLGHALLVMLLVYTFVFVVVTALPGDPISNRLADPDAGFTPAVVAQLEAYYGIDQPLVVRYVQGLFGFLTGDLGLSLADARPVSEKVLEVLPSTLQLAAASLVVLVVVAVGGALLALYAPFRILRAVGDSAPSIVNALPVYLVALLVVHIFSFQLRWFPLVGTEGLAAVILPAFVLGVTISPSVAQVLIASLREARKQEYVTVARSKGLGEVRILFTHLLPATAVTNLTMLGLVVSALLGGAVVTEAVFSRPGLGNLTNEAVLQHDLPVLQAVVLIAAAVYLVLNLVVDLLYPVLDPRIRSGAAR